LGYEERRRWANNIRAISFQAFQPTVCVLIHQVGTNVTDRQSDRQTDRQTDDICDRNTALCTIVHRAVIMFVLLPRDAL